MPVTRTRGGVRATREAEMKRFAISKPYEGPPVMTPWGTECAGGLETVEEYDSELTARVRVAVLNHGLAKKVFTLDEQVEEGLWEEVDTDDN
jgi:hypothetical protein